MGNQQETRYIVIPDRLVGDVKYQQQESKFKKAIESDKKDPIDLAKGAKEWEALHENEP